MLLVALVALFIYLLYINLEKKNNVISAVNWTNQQTSIKEAFNNSELAIIATIKEVKSYEQHKAVFTDYSIEILEVLKTNSAGDSQKIQVSLSGGDINGVHTRIERQKLLNIDETYLFLLNKRYPNDLNSNQYSPIGGYQGILSVISKNISGKKIFIGQQFNFENVLEKDIIQKDIESTFRNAIFK